MKNEVKNMKQKWEELIPYKEQMEKWATLAAQLEAGKNLHPRARSQQIGQILISPEEDELLILYEVLKVAFEQFEDATKDELRLLE